MRLGIRQSRYFGKIKTRFQVFMSAVVANLSLVVGFLRRTQKPVNASDPQNKAGSPASEPQSRLLDHTWTLGVEFGFFLKTNSDWFTCQSSAVLDQLTHPNGIAPSKNGGFWTDF